MSASPEIHSSARQLRISALGGIPPVKPGDDLTAILVHAIRESGLNARNQDILVVTQKIVSKAEGRLVRLSDVTPSGRAMELGKQLDKDPRKVEVILRESRKILRAERSAKTGLGILICETRHGFICANAGVDESNLSDPDSVLLLPEDPDKSAEKLRKGIRRELDADVAVVITDSFGRPWRLGIVNVAIGVSGCPAIVDYRGKADCAGHPLKVTEIAVADEIAAVAGLVMGKLDMIPAVLLQGFHPSGTFGRAADLLRPAPEDLFR